MGQTAVDGIAKQSGLFLVAVDNTSRHLGNSEIYNLHRLLEKI